MTLQTAILQGTKLLEDEAIAAPRLTAEVLLMHALQKERSYLYAHSDEELSETAWIHYGRYLHERMKGKPTQYITGLQEFYGRDFRVTPSQGSHFFQNLTAFQIGYFTVNPDAGEGALDWQWLNEQPAMAEEGCVRHLRFAEPFRVVMNSRSSQGVIFKPVIFKPVIFKPATS